MLNMVSDNKKIAGLLFFVGAVQFVLAVIIVESLYSGYSVGQQAVSDLGTYNLAGNPAIIFNISAIMLGILVITGSYFIKREFKNKLFTSLLVIGGISVVGIGVFSEDVFLLAHVIFSYGIFIFGTAAIIMSYKFEKPPFSYTSLILGATAAAIATAIVVLNMLYVLGIQFDLSYGGLIERFILYPDLLGLIGLGAYLLGESSKTATPSKA